MKRVAILAVLSCILLLLLAGNAPALSTGTGVARSASQLSVARLLASNGTCIGVDDPTAPVAVQEQAMECMINFARAQAGLARLGDSRKLDASADAKAGDVLRCGQFSHEACGRDFLYWFRRTGYLPRQCWSAGENLAWGVGGMGSIRSVLKAWLRSPPHRENMLSSSFDEFGVSLRAGRLSGVDDAQIWVNHFGRHC
jgi:uncharacterized protein YkwD